MRVLRSMALPLKSLASTLKASISHDGPVLGMTLVAAADADVDGREDGVVQLDLGLLVLLVRCWVVLPLDHPNTLLLIPGD